MKKFIYTLAFLHLFLITITIFHGVDSWLHGGFMEKPLAILTSMNYSVWRYGFFSPDVGKSIEVEMKVYEDSAQVTTYSTLDGFTFFTANQESRNRFYGFKVQTTADTIFQDLCARSAAVKMMNLHPQSWRVDYLTRSIHYPGMKDFRSDSAIREIDIYQTQFELY